MNAQKLTIVRTECFVDTSFFPIMGKLTVSPCKGRRINPWPFLALLLFAVSLLSIQKLCSQSHKVNRSYPAKQVSETFSQEDFSPGAMFVASGLSLDPISMYFVIFAGLTTRCGPMLRHLSELKTRSSRQREFKGSPSIGV